ncbi:hypothetical protein LSH36_479g00043 [Paralvinella palmiformis]|uniref:Uncharacterized protein n=1 Tax=Paralvinella palmiformis TaxID=53620 RepID=A0AAD9JAA2_9ANNE|nr:hypothetical protein LSH36_479g00043 [Paralvinella palmiformis]
MFSPNGFLPQRISSLCIPKWTGKMLRSDRGNKFIGARSKQANAKTQMYNRKIKVNYLRINLIGLTSL